MAERGTEFRSRLWLKDSMALFFEANANSSASPMEKIQHGAKFGPQACTSLLLNQNSFYLPLRGYLELGVGLHRL